MPVAFSYWRGNHCGSFTAGSAITLTLTGASTPTHTVALSQADLTQISGGTRVQKTSSNDNTHTHAVTFN